MTNLISAEKLSLSRQGKTILDNVSLSIAQQDSVTIVGPNGAGKSMLLKCMLGLCKPDTGKIQRKDALRIAYVPQRFELNPIMPITTKRFLRLHRDADVQKVEQISEEVGIDLSQHKPLSALSSGELQRVLLARSLLGDPELLVLDEPAQNLDMSGQINFYKLLERIYKQRQLSILMVSHDLHMVMASTMRVVCLYHHICCEGEPHIITKNPEFVSLFGNDMADMVAIYQHKHDHSHE
jgi:zinc transport system ATP-binding protein